MVAMLVDYVVIFCIKKSKAIFGGGGDTINDRDEEIMKEIYFNLC